MIAEATEALTRLDSAALEVLAARLEALLAPHAPLPTTPEILARQRVFAGVMAATAENMNILRRMAHGPEEGSRWAL